MDANQVKTFCAAAAQLTPALGEYASIEGSQRKPEADALIRQLRVAAGAINMTLMEVPRMVPLPGQPMPVAPMQLRSPNIGAPS